MALIATLEGNLRDQNQVAVEGAQVYLYDADGDLAAIHDELGQDADNPITSGADGYWQAFVPSGVYTARYFWGGRERRIEANMIAGRDPLQVAVDAANAAAAAANYHPSQAEGEAFTVAGDFFSYPDGAGGLIYAERTSGGSTIIAEAATKAQLDTKAPNAITQDGTGAIASTVPASVKALGILAREDFGATFTSTGDDQAALQAAIDAADEHGRPLILPAGGARILSPLYLTGRDVQIYGAGMTKTSIVAGAAMPVMFDIADEDERQFSPFHLQGFLINGNSGLAEVGVDIRYRHEFLLQEVRVAGCTINIREQDTWLGRHYAGTCDSGEVAADLVGSNHSSAWRDWGFRGCSDIHVKIGANGTAGDGNRGLTFDGCDIEFGSGAGMDIAAQAQVLINGGYHGENIDGPVFTNRGNLRIAGAVLFYGAGASAPLVEPAGGMATVIGCTLNGQTFGSASMLIGNSPSNTGRIKYTDIEANVTIGGDHIYDGDPIANLSGARSICPSMGSAWTGAGIGGAIVTKNRYVNTGEFICTTGGSEMYVYAPLNGPYRYGERLQFIIVYKSTKPLILRLSEGPDGTARTMGLLPARAGLTTYVKLDSLVAEGDQALDLNTIKLVMANPEQDDSLVIYKATMADSSTAGSVAGQFNNLAMMG